MTLEEFASSLAKELAELSYELDEEDVEEARLEVGLRRQNGNIHFQVAKVLTISG